MNQKQITKVVFLSNYFSHHQKSFSDEMFATLGDGYFFIETETMDDERKKLGWGMTAFPSYVVTNEKLQKNIEFYMDLINSADVVIVGSAPDYLISQRKREKNLIFRYHERPLKKGDEPLKYIYRFVKWRMMNKPRHNIYMLCASAYTAADYAKFGLFKKKCYKWGYFPFVVQYEDINSLISQKKNNSIIWVARFIDWKHPELAISVAEKLKEDGYKFTLDMIGTGELLEQMKSDVLKRGLSDYVTIHGAMTPEEVRKYMEQSEIHIFTSDRNEGWGAVLNESMNSACAVVASHAIGAVPFMVEDGNNGLVYQDGNENDLYLKVKKLLDNEDLRKDCGINAYNTVIKDWNAEVAAERIVILAQSIVEGNIYPNVYNSGLCSQADVIKNDWC